MSHSPVHTLNPVANSSDKEWWAERWLDALASFGRTLRSARAHNYARQGNILSLTLKGNKVLAKVQGTAAEPYLVTISLEKFTDEQWQNVVKTLSERALFAAKLLSGEMPREVEEVFTANGLSLFPLTKSDIRSRCTCPDKANPCKHIGAVYYVLGDRFAEDPFVLFQLRGRSQEEVLLALRQLRGEQAEGGDVDLRSEPVVSGEPPTTDPEAFWRYEEELEPSLVVIAPPPSSETVLDLLGPIPLKPDGAASASQSQAAIAATMERLKTIYQAVSQQAIVAAMNTDSSEP